MPLLPTGPHLGDLTREISDQEEVKYLIVVGQKNYAYIKNKKQTGESHIIVKCKGITLTAKILEEDITIEKMRKMCEKYIYHGEIVTHYVPQNRIHAGRDQVIRNLITKKKYSTVRGKRLTRGNETFPKGYVWHD